MRAACQRLGPTALRLMDGHERTAPRSTHAQILGPCEWVASPGKRDFADVVKSMNLEMGRFSRVVQVSPI